MRKKLRKYSKSQTYRPIGQRGSIAVKAASNKDLGMIGETQMKRYLLILAFAAGLALCFYSSCNAQGSMGGYGGYYAPVEYEVSYGSSGGYGGYTAGSSGGYGGYTYYAPPVRYSYAIYPQYSGYGWGSYYGSGPIYVYYSR